MQFKTLAILSALGAIGSTQDVDSNDVPSVCRSVCQSTVDITTRCDAQNDDDDSGYINCICSASNASSFVPECEACIAANNETDNDVRDLVNSCSFTTTTYNSAATSGSASLTPANSVTAVTTDSSLASTSATGTGSSATGQTTGTTTTTATAGTAAGSAGATGVAAPAATAGFGGLAVAVLAGLPAIL